MLFHCEIRLSSWSNSFITILLRLAQLEDNTPFSFKLLQITENDIFPQDNYEITSYLSQTYYTLIIYPKSKLKL